VTKEEVQGAKGRVRKFNQYDDVGVGPSQDPMGDTWFLWVVR
jgi:hypothetical protein